MTSLSHEGMWRAIDDLAARHGLTVAGMARKAGLDATTLNRSRRHGRDGRDRWPGSQSLWKILNATGASLESFVALIGGEASGAAMDAIYRERAPVRALATEAGKGNAAIRELTAAIDPDPG